MQAPVLPADTNAFAWPLAYQPAGHMHGAVAPRSRRFRRAILHGDPFGGVHDFDGQLAPSIVLVQFAAHHPFVTHQDDADARVFSRPGSNPPLPASG